MSQKKRSFFDLRKGEDGQRYAVLNTGVAKIIFSDGVEADLTSRILYTDDAIKNVEFLAQKGYLDDETLQKQLAFIQAKNVKFVSRIPIKD